MVTANDIIGVGVYSIEDAQRLVGMATRSIRHWLGATTPTNGNGHARKPRTQHRVIDGHVALGFLDLIELRVVHALRANEFAWEAIRDLRSAAARALPASHPFADDRLAEFAPAIGPSQSDIDFEDHLATRWWPMGRGRGVVIDPRRSFGQPIVTAKGIPTRTLARAVKAEGDAGAVARWYGIDERAVGDALAFERKLAA